MSGDRFPCLSFGGSNELTLLGAVQEWRMIVRLSCKLGIPIGHIAAINGPEMDSTCPPRYDDSGNLDEAESENMA